MKNLGNIQKGKQLVLSIVITLLCFNLAAQSPPKLYPYGDEFPLGFYDLNEDFSKVSAIGWNFGHSYAYRVFYNNTSTHLDNDTVFPDFYKQGYSLDTVFDANNVFIAYDTNFCKYPMYSKASAPIPQIYFDSCSANDMNAMGRLSYINKGTQILKIVGTDTFYRKHVKYPKSDAIIAQEINKQRMSNNIAFWDLPEEIRFTSPTYSDTCQKEWNILTDYSDLTRVNDPMKRPVYMHLFGEYRVNHLVDHIEHLDIIPTQCYPEHIETVDDLDSTVLEQGEVPHSFVRWRLEETKRAIDSAGFTLGKDYLNGEKNIFAPIELYSTGCKDKHYDAFTTIPEKTWHDFWLALACDVKGIMVYSYRAGKNHKNILGNTLKPNLDTLHHAVSLFKQHQLGKILLQGKEDANVDTAIGILSGPTHTAIFDLKPYKSFPTVSGIRFNSIKMLTKKWQGDTYIFAVNSTESTVNFEIKFDTEIPISTLPTFAAQELISNSNQNIQFAANLNTGTYKARTVHTLPAYGAAVFKYKSSNTLDLSIHDCPTDNGYNAGYIKTLANVNNSSDIWVRNQADGFTTQEHQSPKYDALNPITNHVYVKVRNISGVTSDGTDTLNLYWSKSATASGWSSYWDGSHADPSMGASLGALAIPPLDPDSSIVLSFPWVVVPDTDTLAGMDWGHCLLARIESAADPINTAFNFLSDQVFYNNNISLKNCEVINLKSWKYNPNNLIVREEITKKVYVGNTTNTSATIDFSFQVPKEYRLSHIIDSTKVSLQFDANGWNLFQAHCQSNPNVTIEGEQRISLNANEINFENVVFPANTRVPIALTFDFLIAEESGAEYQYLVAQKSSTADSLGNYNRGAVHIIANIEAIEPFSADAGADKEIDRGESVTLSAEQINAAATYNWYDMDGNLIYTGTDVSVSPEDSRRYHLEIIANGISAYDAVAVAVNPYFITAMSPNPASSIVNIDYSADGANVAYIMLINQNTGAANMYPINTYDSQKSINVAYYSPGTYTVLLICDGVYYSPQSLSVY